MKTIGNQVYVDEYMRGANDCRNGIDHTSDKSEAYTSGYSAQYEYEQHATALNERMEARRS